MSTGTITITPELKLARTTDPTTSHEAAAAITPKLNVIQQEVLNHFKQITVPITDLDLVTAFSGRYGDSTLRTRRSELVKKGLIVRAGVGFNYRGSAMTTWKLA